MKIRVYFVSVSEIKKALPDFDSVDIASDDESIIVETGAEDDRAMEILDFLRDKFGSFLVYPGIDCASERLGKVLSATENIIATAESCTAGLVSGAVADIPGSSSWLWGGYITYDNSAKIKLGVDCGVLTENGAVSSQVAVAMAEKALENSEATVAVSVTGIAGPGGGSHEKPVGTVWFGIAMKNRTSDSYHFKFSGDRNTVRKKSVLSALMIAENFVQGLTVFPYCE